MKRSKSAWTLRRRRKRVHESERRAPKAHGLGILRSTNVALRDHAPLKQLESAFGGERSERRTRLGARPKIWLSGNAAGARKARPLPRIAATATDDSGEERPLWAPCTRRHRRRRAGPVRLVTVCCDPGDGRTPPFATRYMQLAFATAAAVTPSFVGVVKRRRQVGPDSRHRFTSPLAFFATGVAWIGTALLTVIGLSEAEARHGVSSMLFRRFMSGLANPNIWNWIANAIIMIVAAIVILTIAILIFTAGSADADATANASDRSDSYASGRLSEPASNAGTVNNRYGCKLAEREAGGIFWSDAVYDRHGVKIGIAYEQWDSFTEVKMGDNAYLACDGAWDDDRYKDSKRAVMQAEQSASKQYGFSRATPRQSAVS